MAQVEILKADQDGLLADFLGSSKEATVFHTPAWRDVIASTYSYEPMYLARVENDRCTALLPLMFVKSWLTGKRLVSLPFSNVCGPIGLPDYRQMLLDKALAIHQEIGSKVLEIRTQADRNPVADSRFTPVDYFVTSVVKLDSDPDRLWKSFRDRTVRAEVRQSVKKGIQVRAGEDLADLKRFYSLFVRTRLKHGVPPQSFTFFLNVWNHMKPHSLDLLLATHGDKTVAGLITLGFGDTLYGSYIGSNPAYRSHRVHQILIWKAMEMGCVRGFTRFDFLRTPKKSHDLRYFKNRWDAYEVDLNYLYYPKVYGTASTVEETTKYGLMTRVLRRSPLLVGRALGRMMYKHMG